MINKDPLEQLCLHRFCVSGYEYVYGPNIVHDGAAPEMNDYQQVVLRGRVPAALSSPLSISRRRYDNLQCLLR